MSCLAKAPWLLRVLAIGLSLSSCTRAQNLTDDQLQLVVARLADGAIYSWELGTRAQALLELNAPFYSVFSNTTLPPPVPPSSSSIPANLTDVISIAQATVAKLNDSAVPQPLVADDGAAGDPASIGIAVLLANLTNAAAPAPNITNTTASAAKSGKTSSTAATTTTTTTSEAAAATATDVTATKNVTGSATNGTNATVPSYANAAARQLEFLLTTVPRTSDGAISHRVNEVQLWSDNVYMVPPFLAYYGVVTQNKSLVAEAYNQIKLYRKYLRDTGARNLWRHIQLGAQGNDDGHWSTGNAWATAGMLRVLATIKHSAFAGQFQSEQTDLQNWATEILDGMYSHSTENHLFHNYVDDNGTFADCSSTALITASTYRLAVLAKQYKHIPQAEKCRQSISDGTHFDATGWLAPVVDPFNWSLSGAESPEGQAFVVEMQAAWRDWVGAGAPGVSGGAAALRGAGVRGVLGVLVLGVVVALVGPLM